MPSQREEVVEEEEEDFFEDPIMVVEEEEVVEDNFRMEEVAAREEFVEENNSFAAAAAGIIDRNEFIATATENYFAQGSYFEYENTILLVGRMVEIQSDTLLCGQRDDSMRHALVIGTKEGAIDIMELQKPGGKMLPASDFLRGFEIPQKVIFSSPDDSPALIR